MIWLLVQKVKFGLVSFSFSLSNHSKFPTDVHTPGFISSSSEQENTDRISISFAASADNSVLLASFSPSDLSLPPTPVLRIPHPTQTRALLSLPISVPTLQAPYLLTTSSDELIRIFDLNSESLEPSPQREERRQWKGLSGLKEGDELPGCVREIEGHTNEVVSLSSYLLENDEGRKEVWILSAGLDGTLRRWNWTEMLEEKREKLVLIEVNQEEEEVKESMLTEEEERELEELMADD